GNDTDGVGILCVAGPAARAVLAACTPDDVSNAALPWLSCAPLCVAEVPVLALRLSYSGELGYELHAPNAHLGALWDALWAAGEAHGVAPFGSKALDSLRLEKGYRGAHELANDTSHPDVGLMRFADTGKAFVGREAMLARSPRSRVALLALDGEDTDALIGEAVYAGDVRVGSVTSAAYGHTVGRSLVFAFLTDAGFAAGAELAITLLGKRVRATRLDTPPWDPDNTRLKA
ncbi:MAG: glycine cleavage T C-terminal barrel domain-containing protein, partial [Pseudomonadota bacterium]